MPTLDRPSELAVSDKRPLLIDRYLTDAIEVDVDCLADGKDSYIAGIMEHIEEAGIHSGDSACSLPPHNLLGRRSSPSSTGRPARSRFALKVGGLMNVQYAIKDGDIYVLEVNPRASRTVPFVAKVTGIPAAKIAARIMAGETLASFRSQAAGLRAAAPPRHVGVKEAVFPFARFGAAVDTVLGPEMKSTGEVMGIDRDYNVAFVKSQLGGGSRLPKTGTVFVSVKDADKPRILEATRLLAELGLPGLGDVGDPTLPRRERRRRGQDQQGRRRPAAHRRRHQKRRSAAGFQHHRGGHRAQRQPVAPARGPLA